jgi:hypothetical protein
MVQLLLAGDISKKIKGKRKNQQKVNGYEKLEKIIKCITMASSRIATNEVQKGRNERKDMRIPTLNPHREELRTKRMPVYRCWP